MEIYAHFKSVNTSEGIKIFRYDTALHSKNGSGEIIGLIYMMNPGKAMPNSQSLCQKLLSTEYATEQPVFVTPDETLNNVIRFVKQAYEINQLILPEKFTIHVENLFNIREQNSQLAKTYAKKLIEAKDIMFKHRDLENKYQFVWLAWGKVNIEKERQAMCKKRFPNAIAVNKMNCAGKIIQIPYPKHPLYMNLDFFLEAAKGKISN